MIPVNEPLFEEREFEYIAECLRTGWVSSSGRFIDDFEEAWASYCGVPYGVAVCNGTAALQIAVDCLGLKPGDEVIMPTFTIISCAQAITRNGAVPVLVDSDPETWCMDVSQIEARITPKTKAIMAVHIYGHPVDMDPLLELAEKQDLHIIEDAAEAHGAEYLSHFGNVDPKWRKCGSLGDISVFSFYANKPITTGEGGMIMMKDHNLAQRARSLRNLCFRTERRFYHTELGYNFRMTNLQAALGLAQVERINKIIRHKRWVGETYSEQLRDVPGLELPVEKSWAKNIYWMYGVVLNEFHKLDASEFAEHLREKGVDTRPFFLGMHEQPIFVMDGLFEGEKYPVSERLSRRGLYLPSGMTLSEDEVNQVCQAVREVLL
jgi:perosamine synthetase